jgi:hypothetical protein
VNTRTLPASVLREFVARSLQSDLTPPASPPVSTAPPSLSALPRVAS